MAFKMNREIKFNDVEESIFTVRDQKVLIASDEARLYGVATRDINKSVKNNPNKFPKGYIIEMTAEEKAEVVENFHHLRNLKFSSLLPKAFTEKGFICLLLFLKVHRQRLPLLRLLRLSLK